MMRDHGRINVNMKNAIRFASVMLVVLLLLPLVGCAGGGDTKQTTPADTTSAAPEDTSAAQTDEIETTTTAQETTAQQVSTGGYQVLNYSDMKAMWLSQYDLNKVYCTDSGQRSEQSFKKLIVKILENVKSVGMNTIIVQVRPNADSMYPSEYYPMSAYVVGSYGKDADYDPFAIIVEEAHKLELSVHAWINPLRGMTDTNIKKVSDKYQIKKWYDDNATRGKQLVKNGNNWYLNPAYEEARQLIIDGACEIIENYNVDGLHMDDYFYPTQDSSFDSAAYSAYVKSGGRESLEDWRRSNLNALVSGLWRMVKEHDKGIIFGISPAGNYDTVYNKQYADIYEWCSTEGYIDYICPQVYFGLEHGSYDFEKVSKKYQSMIKTDSVTLIIGMTLGKAVSGSRGETDKYAGSGASEWIKNRDVLKRELEMTKSFEKCSGVAYFCYQYFFDPVSGSPISDAREEREAFLPLLKEISWQK